MEVKSYKCDKCGNVIENHRYMVTIRIEIIRDSRHNFEILHYCNDECFNRRFEPQNEDLLEKN